MWIHGLRSTPPASSSRTRYLPDSLSRPATAQPAEPAPVTMKSKVSATPVTMFPPSSGTPTSLTLAKGRRAGKRDGPAIARLCRFTGTPTICRPAASQDDRVEQYLPVLAHRLCSGMIVCRIFGWMLLIAGLSALLRDGLVWFDTGRWVPLAIGDLRGWSDGIPELVLVFWVALTLIVLGIALMVLCRRRQTQRRRFRRRPS